MRNEERSFPTRNLEMAQEEVSKDTPFPCNVTGGRSPEIPESVHRLRPGDIDVIAAMGDSLTAGAGLYATNLLEVFVENRGASAFIGGQGTWRTHMTLPNILKEFNPKLIGYAYGDSLTTQSPSQLDVAEIGAMSRDMPFMAKYLVRRIKNDSRIDVKRHWKLISLFIGSNDFCADICTFSSPWSILDNHKLDLINTFKILRDNLPRTLVVLHIIPHLKELVAARKGKNFLKCYLTTTFGCPCLLALQFRDQRQEYYEILQSFECRFILKYKKNMSSVSSCLIFFFRWQEIDEEVADYPEFHRNDFTIVVSPVLKHTKLPLANNVWNTLLEPVNNKTSTWNPLYEKFACPTTERPFLMTRENSKGINEVKG
ncbi:hypothetical protein E2986_02096 [Frieseomelitta varia]|uniref:Phospholipase B1, membrane-associated n=1 Tax=Frieseomelitta varia TaxID=561572 RepID=A0A833S7D5_9HYME|nr:hypothetical protein E2986_02096 [Frieseomelitta varia]